MKNLMYALIAILVTCSLASQADDWKVHKKNIRISVQEAAKDPGLSAAIKAQIPSDFLVPDQQIYIARVKYNNNTYMVYGTKIGWLRFLFSSHKGQLKTDPRHKDRTE